jgi:hypothetical protein
MHNKNMICCHILAEEREELEILNNCRQKQLELQHQQLLHELEQLQSVRTASISSSTSLSTTFVTAEQDQSSIADAYFSTADLTQ